MFPSRKEPNEGNNESGVDVIGVSEQLNVSISPKNGNDIIQRLNVNQTGEEEATVNQVIEDDDDSNDDPNEAENCDLFDENLNQNTDGCLPIKKWLGKASKSSRKITPSLAANHSDMAQLSVDNLDQLHNRSHHRQRHISIDEFRLLEYNMGHPRRGKCIILNHEFFRHRPNANRNGTQEDAYNLRDCFRSLYFEVEIYKDLGRDDLFDKLKEISQEDHSDADCFVLCILTHGEETTLDAFDGEYKKDKVFECFMETNCPTLIGKPKLFFIQACRGGNYDRGSEVHLPHDIDAGKKVLEENIVIPKPLIKQSWINFLISYSTVEGYFAFRHTINGSWFVQALVPLLKNEGHETDIMSILTQVNHKVAFKFSTLAQGSLAKQIPQTYSSLTRKLIFRKKRGVHIKQTMSYRDDGTTSSD